MDKKDAAFVVLIGAAVMATLVVMRPHGGRPPVREPSPVLTAASALYPVTPP